MFGVCRLFVFCEILLVQTRIVVPLVAWFVGACTDLVRLNLPYCHLFLTPAVEYIAFPHGFKFQISDTIKDSCSVLDGYYRYVTVKDEASSAVQPYGVHYNERRSTEKPNERRCDVGRKSKAPLP